MLTVFIRMSREKNRKLCRKNVLKQVQKCLLILCWQGILINKKLGYMNVNVHNRLVED